MPGIGPGTRELNGSAAPEDAAAPPERQAESLYARLARMLAARGSGLGHVVREKVFFRDLEGDRGALRDAREAAYAAAGARPAPATWLGQAPCDPEARFAVEVHALVPPHGGAALRPLEGLPAPATGCEVSAGGIRRVHVCNLTGDPGEGFARQAEEMFARAARALEALGIGFRDVVRTWIYLPRIDAHYDALNAIRDDFFRAQGVRRIPASTGIQGLASPRGCEALLDLDAVFPDPGVDAATMHTPSMNEALSYGSSFSRGLLLRTPGSTTAHVSGTASIDQDGRVVHVGDARGQARRMLDNVSSLLEDSGLGWSDAARATVYLKDCAYLADFDAAWRERGLPADLPLTVSRADICRPEWLCEIEVTACRARG